MLVGLKACASNISSFIMEENEYEMGSVMII
jgi:hypothetical protein